MKALEKFFILTLITAATTLPLPEPTYIDYGALAADRSSKVVNAQSNPYHRGCEAAERCRG